MYSSPPPSFSNPNQCLILCSEFISAKKKVTINKRAKKKKKKLNSAGEKSERKKNREPCCRWFQGSSLFRNPFSTKKTSDTTIGTSKPPPQSPSIWRRWSSCQWSYRKNIPKEEEEENSENVVVPLDRFEWRCEEKVQRSIEETFVPATPPKNALLLMRCRSAPHWSSTLVSGNIIKETNPPPPVAIAGNVTAERIHEENDIYPDDVSNVASCCVSLKDEEDHGTTSFASRPLLLSRSNSGPAKLTHHVGLLDREDRDPMNELLQVAREGSNE